jgi:hypothetical protein
MINQSRAVSLFIVKTLAGVTSLSKHSWVITAAISHNLTAMLHGVLCALGGDIFRLNQGSPSPNLITPSYI